jgi:hypothetical protein
LQFNNCYSQQLLDAKRDFFWVLGVGPNNLLNNIGHTSIDFRDQMTVDTSCSALLNFSVSNTSFCDTAGDLLLYSNGFDIMNKNHERILNWDTLTPSYEVSLWFQNGERIPKGALFLPKPNDISKCFLLLNRADTVSPIPYTLNDLYTVEIDLNGDSGLGSLEVNNRIITDTIAGNIAVTRHANGRDWWIIVPELFSENIYRFLLTPSGFIDYGKIRIDTYFNNTYTTNLFSPNGNKLLISQGSSGSLSNSSLTIYDFNRCDGTFTLNYYENLFSTIGETGLTISNNSKFCYLTLDFSKKIFQYQIDTTDILGSKTLVAVYDNFNDTTFGSLNTYFHYSQIGPDGKIYINSVNSIYLHVIENPNQRGVLCSVNQHSLNIGNLNYSIPYFPYYRLGPVDGSACDSLGLDHVEIVYGGGVGITEPPPPPLQALVTPTPAHSSCTIHLSETLKTESQLQVFDAAGRVVFAASLRAATLGYGLDLRAYPTGLYYFAITQSGTALYTGKILKE